MHSLPVAAEREFAKKVYKIEQSQKKQKQTKY